MRIKRMLFSAVFAICCAATCLITAFAAGSVTITCGVGGTIANITGNVSIEDGVIFVNDDGPVSFDVITDDGFQIDGIMMNGQSMGAGYIGAGPKTVTLSPKGAEIQIQVAFRDVSAVASTSAPDEQSEELKQASVSDEVQIPSNPIPSSSESEEDYEVDQSTETAFQNPASPAGNTDGVGIDNISESIEETPFDWSELGLYVAIAGAAIGSAAAVVYFIKKRS